jgi:hypothetical protein
MRPESSRPSQDTRTENVTARTISDFGEQWVSFQDNPGDYGSVALLEDLFGPLLGLHDVRDKGSPTSAAVPAAS